MTNVFSSITRGGFVPDDFKKGIKIPLFKGGGKRRDIRDNHRGVTLLSVISKWYE